jgi:phytol kinase
MPALEFGRFLPDLATAATVLPVAVAVALAGAMAAAWLHGTGVRTAYTRKIFHFVIFTAAAGVHLLWALGGVVVFGAVVSLAVLYAVLRGDGHPLYEALARPGDAPRRSLFILVPLVTTAAGGMAANLFFPAAAFIGYLVCGWGDAIAEPVGSRWGAHRYTVPSLAGVPATRSLEGSAAVFLVGSAAALAGLLLAGAALGGNGHLVGLALLTGAVAAGVEAVSHHGLDNFTVQVAAAGVVSTFL